MTSLHRRAAPQQEMADEKDFISARTLPAPTPTADGEDMGVKGGIETGVLGSDMRPMKPLLVLLPLVLALVYVVESRSSFNKKLITDNASLQRVCLLHTDNIALYTPVSVVQICLKFGLFPACCFKYPTAKNRSQARSKSLSPYAVTSRL